MNTQRVLEFLSQMARYGEAASAEIGDDMTDVCRASMDNLMLQLGITFWLVNDHGRHPHVLQAGKDGEDRPVFLRDVTPKEGKKK